MNELKEYVIRLQKEYNALEMKCDIGARRLKDLIDMNLKTINVIQSYNIDEAFKRVSDILEPKKINHSLDDLKNNVEEINRSLDNLVDTINAISSLEYTYKGTEPFIKIEVEYIMLKDGELEKLFSFRDRNKNCLITFK